MHATTVRFSPDLWSVLEREAASAGVSAAQFVRDAAVLRLGALAGLRGDTRADDPVGALAQLVRRHDGPVAPALAADPRRVAAVHATGLLDDPAVGGFRRFVESAAHLLRAPVCAVSLIDDRRHVIVDAVSDHGVHREPREVPLHASFCRYVVEDRAPMAVPDVRRDPLLGDMTLAAEAGVVAYLGVPVFDRSNLALGTICVVDHEPRGWTEADVRLLEGLAAGVASEIERRAHTLLP